MNLLIAFFEVYKAVIIYLRKIQWLAIKLLKIKYVKITAYPNFKTLFIPEGFVTKLLFVYSPFRYFRRSFEYKIFDKIHKHVLKGDNVVDIGANTGIISTFMSKIVGAQGKVFAIEASKKNCEVLSKNIHLNEIKNVEILSYAVSEKKETLFLGTPNGGHNDALLSLSKEKNETSEIVETETFDTISQIHNISNIKLIKIDIEGAELLFLKGAQEFFSRERPIIIFETLEVYTQRFNYSVIDVLLELKKYDYKIEQINHETWIAQI